MPAAGKPTSQQDDDRAALFAVACVFVGVASVCSAVWFILNP